MSKIYATLESIKNEAVKKALDYKAALERNDMQGMGSAIAALKESEKAYKKASFDEFVKMIRCTENPVMTAIKALQYEVLKHKEIRTEGVLTGIELYVTDEKVNMEKVFDRLGLANTWTSFAVKLNYMFTLKAAIDHGIESEEFQKIKTNYMIADEVKAALEGATPTSTTQMIPHLQNVLDAMIFVPREDGKNTYRVIGKDINALKAWQTSKDRRAVGGTEAAGDKAFNGYVTEIIHCIVTGTGYRLTGKNINGSRVEPKHVAVDLVLPAEESADEAPKAKKAPSKKAKKAEKVETATPSDIATVPAEQQA